MYYTVCVSLIQVYTVYTVDNTFNPLRIRMILISFIWWLHSIKWQVKTPYWKMHYLHYLHFNYHFPHLMHTSFSDDANSFNQHSIVRYQCLMNIVYWYNQMCLPVILSNSISNLLLRVLASQYNLSTDKFVQQQKNYSKKI